MRSRYSAYAVGRLDHVFRTWHPRTQPDEIEPTSGLDLDGLTIIDAVGGQPTDDEGVVESDASYQTAAGPGVQLERSRFLRRARRWLYLDAGEVGRV